MRTAASSVHCLKGLRMPQLSDQVSCLRLATHVPRRSRFQVMKTRADADLLVTWQMNRMMLQTSQWV